ncbi:MAG: hypothetical protein PWP46_1644 [Fusobacteriaceae bacterium]|jgi:hypothetical protein|nr:hypothetical protein [Fusobacteriales bacterium]MDN5304758.1 hypothetical protein [Fusobacteriaceae bacterium]
MEKTKYIKIAEWMLEKIQLEDYVYQEEVVEEILEKFGEEFIYYNERGSLAINKNVLKEFRKISPDVVWERRGKCWRKRDEYDEPGRQQS